MRISSRARNLCPGEGRVRHRELGTPRLKGMKHRAALYEILAPSEAATAGASDERRRAGAGTVLIVDDEPRDARCARAVLAAEFRVLRAPSGPAASTCSGPRTSRHLTRLQDAGMTGVEMLRESLTNRAERSGSSHRYTDVDSLMEAVKRATSTTSWPSPGTPTAARGHPPGHRAQRAGPGERPLRESWRCLQRCPAAGRRDPGPADSVRQPSSAPPPACGSRSVWPARSRHATRSCCAARPERQGALRALIHDSGERRGRKFVAQNCGALSEALLESELFGHGAAPSPAPSPSAGGLRGGPRGTILLDEIGETTRPRSSAAARAPGGEVRRVGESTTRKVDVRVIAHERRPRVRVREGAFRRDLYYV